MTRRDVPSLFGDEGSSLRITAITPVASNPNLRRVRLGRKVVATLRASDVETLSLRTDTSWTPSLAAAVARLVAEAKARKDALAMLARRAWSRSELAERLESKGSARDVALRMVEEMASHGWMDDRAYASDVAESITRRGPAARALVEQALKRRGVDGDVARAAAAEATPESTPESKVMEEALTLARRKLATLKGVSRSMQVRRIGGLLSRRGFDEEFIAAVLQRLGIESGSEPA